MNNGNYQLMYKKYRERGRERERGGERERESERRRGWDDFVVTKLKCSFFKNIQSLHSK